MGDQQFEALSKYGQDLTAKAARLDPVIGRDEEIRRSVRILCRRTKNNPVLIGEPGEANSRGGTKAGFSYNFISCLADLPISLPFLWVQLMLKTPATESISLACKLSIASE